MGHRTRDDFLCVTSPFFVVLLLLYTVALVPADAASVANHGIYAAAAADDIFPVLLEASGAISGSAITGTHSCALLHGYFS